MSRRRLVARNQTRGTLGAEPLEEAASLWGKFMGLMGRAALPAGAGLWLPGENGIHMLFMRFRIDAVFLAPPSGGEDGPRRVLMARRSIPCWRGIVWFVRGAKGVLELPVGTIEATGTEPGDEVTITAA
jgi:uncharacterized membrane protein (UPF0127 family)